MKARLIVPSIFLVTFLLDQIIGKGVSDWQDWVFGAATVVSLYEIVKAVSSK